MNAMRLNNRQHGTVAVELAIVLPFLLFLMLAIAELGRAIVQYNELTKSTRDAARYLANSAIVGSTEVIDIAAELEKSTRWLLVYGKPVIGTKPILPGLQVSDVDIVVVDTVHVRVDVEYDYVPLLGSVSMPMFGNGPAFDIAIPLRASVAMRAL